MDVNSGVEDAGNGAGGRLKRAAELAGVPALALARMAGVPGRTFQRYISGETTKVPAGVLVDVAREAGCSLAWLLTGEGAERDPPPGAEALAYRKIAVIVRQLSETVSPQPPGEIARPEEWMAVKAGKATVRGSRRRRAQGGS